MPAYTPKAKAIFDEYQTLIDEQQTRANNIFGRVNSLIPLRIELQPFTRTHNRQTTSNLEKARSLQALHRQVKNMHDTLHHQISELAATQQCIEEHLQQLERNLGDESFVAERIYNKYEEKNKNPENFNNIQLAQITYAQLEMLQSHTEHVLAEFSAAQQSLPIKFNPFMQAAPSRLAPRALLFRNEKESSAYEPPAKRAAMGKR